MLTTNAATLQYRSSIWLWLAINARAKTNTIEKIQTVHASTRKTGIAESKLWPNTNRIMRGARTEIPVAIGTVRSAKYLMETLHSCRNCSPDRTKEAHSIGSRAI